MLSCGTMGQFRELSRGNPEKVERPGLVPKGAGLRFHIFLSFGTNGLTLSLFYGIDLPSTVGGYM